MFIGESIGPFRIERELGSGAMGTVYRAIFHKDDDTQKTIALKIVALGLLGNEGAMARFDRESNILKQLRHPNIVRLIATGRYKKTPFIAMEFVDGEPMDRMLTRRGRMGWEEVVGYMKQLCHALQYAHEKGIIHRDLKPSNLMITEAGVLKLTDFGIAKDQDVTALTGMNSTIGTAAYMSPEQCKGDKNLTGKSDLYSLGIVMYELIVGRKPFTAETTVDMFLKHVNEKPVRPTRLVPDLPVWVENMMMHLLEKDKDKRPMDAATVAKMLEEIEIKVAAQESVGAAAANARRIDRKISDAPLDDADKEAARVLRESKGKRRKKKARPAGMPRWLKVLPPLVGLLAIVGVIIYLFKPEGAEKQFAKVAAATTPEDRIDKATAFLARFGSDGGEQVEKAKALLKEARGQRLEAVLAVRFRTQKIRTAQENEDAESYANAWSALEAEGKGDLPRAADFWQKVQARSPETKDNYTEGWAWLAERHLADIRQVEAHVAEIQKELRDRQIYETDWKFDSGDAKSIATAAIRLGGAGGPPMVRPRIVSVDPNAKPLPPLKDDGKVAKHWNDLADLTKEKPQQHSWYLLATRERKNYSELKPEAVLNLRRQVLPMQLGAILSEWQRVANDPNLEVARRDCRNRTRDIVELFADETEPILKKTVEDAKKLLAEMTAKKGERGA